MSNINKTSAMRLIELLHQEPIELLISRGGTLRELAKELGVSHTTIANWIRALEIRSKVSERDVIEQ